MTMSPIRCEDCGHMPHEGFKCFNMASDNDCSCDRRPSIPAPKDEEIEALLEKSLPHKHRLKQIWASSIDLFYYMQCQHCMVIYIVNRCAFNTEIAGGERMHRAFYGIPVDHDKLQPVSYPYVPPHEGAAAQA